MVIIDQLKKQFKRLFEIARIKNQQLRVSHIFQIVLNTALILLALALCVMLAKELLYFIEAAFFTTEAPNQYVIFEHILIFFLYFEFIAMIIVYFQEDYHFPIRYFLYIGITAMIRLVIVDHESAFNTLLHTCAILVLIISYLIINWITTKNSQTAQEIARDGHDAI